MRKLNGRLKKALCFIASFVLAASMLPAAAFAQQASGEYNLVVGTAASSDGSEIVQVVQKDMRSAVLRSDGSLWMWGSNFYGELGDGTQEDRLEPIKVMEGVESVALGDHFSAALKTDGSLWMWGENTNHQLGDGTQEDRSEPIKVMDEVESVALGGFHSAVLKTDGSLWMWGANYENQLGDGTQEERSEPVKVMEGVASVTLGGSHSAALKADGSLWMWGDNSCGQIGDGTQENRSEPVKVMEGVASVSLGSGHSAALKTDGSLWMWGSNFNGKLGDGTQEDHSAPVKIMSGVASVDLGDTHSAALKTDGSLWVWGENYYGQLGNGTDESGSSTPIKIMSGVASVSLGYGHSAALKTDGSLWMWGENICGQIGDGTTENRLSPICIFRDGAWLQGDDIQYREDDSPTSISIAKATVSVAKVGYNGSKQTPKVTVKLGTKTLKKDTDYKVSYLNSKKKAINAAKVKEIGTYYVRITGIGKYTGSVNKKFQIVKGVQPIKHNLNSDAIKFKHKDLVAGKTVKLTVKNIKESAPVKVTSTKPKVVAVKKSGGKYIVTPLKVGSANIKIQTTKTTKHYAKTTKTIKVTVADLKVPTFRVERTFTKDIDDPVFNLEAKCSNDMPITYTSRNKDIATVDKKGNVTLKGKQGTASIRLFVKGDDYFKTSSVDVTITIVGIQAPIDLSKKGWEAWGYDGHPSGEFVQSYATDWNRKTTNKKGKITNADADAGLPVYAMADGTIEYVNPSSGSILIKYSVPLILTNGYKINANHWYSWYGHLKTIDNAQEKIDNRVKGDKTKKGLTGTDAEKKRKVKKGEIVGYIGKTSATNNHLHFSLRGSNAKIKNAWNDCKPISPYWVAGCGLDNADLYDKGHRKYNYCSDETGKVLNLIKDPIPGKDYWEKAIGKKTIVVNRTTGEYTIVKK